MNHSVCTPASVVSGHYVHIRHSGQHHLLALLPQFPPSLIAPLSTKAATVSFIQRHLNPAVSLTHTLQMFSPYFEWHLPDVVSGG